MGAIERFQASPIECKLGITKTLGFVYAGAIQDSKAIFFQSNSLIPYLDVHVFIFLLKLRYIS